MMEFIRALLFLPPGASTVADRVDTLHFFVISVTMLVSIFVFVVTAWFTIRYHRKSDGQLTKRLTATTRHEAFIITIVLSVFILWWVIGFNQYVDIEVPPKDAEAVYVDAKQWMWKFAYADGTSSNDTLTVPVGRPIKLVMTSRDVIHSFYVPSFRLKQDVLPGRYTTLWFEAKAPGVYPIWCAEYCGVSHSLMRGQVVVLSAEGYAHWKRSGEDRKVEADCGRGPGSCGKEDLVARGRLVAERRQCLACHTLDGQSHVGPTWSRLFGSTRVLTDGRHVVADEGYLTRSMMEPTADIVAGFKPVMPTYQGTLTAGETAALVELIRSLRDGPTPSGVTLPTLQISNATNVVNQSDGGSTP